jgi:membrane protease YdiL (CAAX protease family)
MVVLRPGNVYWSFDPSRFVPFLLRIVLIPVQAATEELIFRGYLTQAFGLLARGIWLAWIVQQCCLDCCMESIPKLKPLASER